ncbi:hypothetical protein BKA64DRAFT_644262 [Cadophora sp. MPI-SDFR-AT-0126]|nr:hypothetical protein BKA64DRAFT_644262 [Leotiomycetes sp. MPI-SDFR-AT-0126]
MNSHVAPPGPLPAYNIYRDQDISYKCPVHGCSQSFGAPESLQYHISQSHTFQQNPNGGIYTSPTTTVTDHVNQAVASHAPVNPPPGLQRVSQPQSHIPPSQPNTLQTVPQVQHIRQPLQNTPPNNGQMLPPGIAATVIADAGTGIQNQTPSRVETPVWREKTGAFLKELAHKHSLYANPTSKEDDGKLCAIFDEFYETIDLKWRPPKHDERLWQFFRAELDQIQREMLERGEVFKGEDGIIKRVVMPSEMLMTKSHTPESLATPPVTPGLGNDRHCEGIDLWNALDVDAQAELFRHQLRNAKNRKRLMLEWNEYCAEVRERRERGKTRETKSTTPSIRSSASKTPPAPPAPPAPEPLDIIDVKQIVANKLRELAEKRDRDRQNASEERAAKRLRGDPA